MKTKVLPFGEWGVVENGWPLPVFAILQIQKDTFQNVVSGLNFERTHSPTKSKK